jgi:hypothetical protein
LHRRSDSATSTTSSDGSDDLTCSTSSDATADSENISSQSCTTSDNDDDDDDTSYSTDSTDESRNTSNDDRDDNSTNTDTGTTTDNDNDDSVNSDINIVSSSSVVSIGIKERQPDIDTAMIDRKLAHFKSLVRRNNLRLQDTWPRRHARKIKTSAVLAQDTHLLQQRTTSFLTQTQNRTGMLYYYNITMQLIHGQMH